MAKLSEQVKAVIADSGSVKIVATLNEDGTIHAAPKGTLNVGADGQLEYVEILEASDSYKNVVRSLWYDKKVTVLVVGSDKQSYQIVGTVHRILTAGSEYEASYRKLAESKGFDIAAVIKIDVQGVSDLDPKKAIEKQNKERFFFKHLDSISVNE